MTGKEALQVLVDNTKQLYFNIDIEGLSKNDKEAITTIEQDLEILEIIKQKAKGNRFFKGCLLRMFQEDGEKKTYLDNPPRRIDKNYYKIKEWLEK